MPPLSCPITEDDLNNELARIEALIEPERDLVIAPDPDGVTLTKELMKFEFPIVNADDGSPSARPPLSLDIPRASIGPNIPVASLDQSTWPVITSLDWQMQFYTLGGLAVGYHRCGLIAPIIRSFVQTKVRRASPNVAFDALDPSFSVNVWNYGGVATMVLTSHPTRDILYVIDVETLWNALGANLDDGGVKSTFRLELDRGTGSFSAVLPAWALSLQANNITFDLAHGETAQYSRQYYHLVPAGSANVTYRAHSAVSLTASSLNMTLAHQTNSGQASSLTYNPRTFIEAIGYSTG